VNRTSTASSSERQSSEVGESAAMVSGAVYHRAGRGTVLIV
jgi:hypothetical protein